MVHMDEETIHSECSYVVIPESQAQLLARLIGRRLERIRFDGLSASLEFDSCALIAYPEPGCGGSPLRPNEEEIMGLFVRPVTAEESTRNPSRVARGNLEQLTQRGCANLVDIGTVIGLEESDSVVIRTNGYAWAVLVTAEPAGCAHHEIAAEVDLWDRNAGPLLRAS